jgi:transposase InsO family protein
VEAIREASTRPQGPDRRQVHRAAEGLSQRLLLPVHGDRRLHETAGAAALRPSQPEDGNSIRRLRAREISVSGRGHPDRQRLRVPGWFHWHVLDKGIGHSYIKPMRPRLNGKVERSHRIDAEEFYRLLDGVVIDDSKVFNKKLQEWEHFYNYARPHGALGGQTPYERLRQKTILDVTHPRQSHIRGLTRGDRQSPDLSKDPMCGRETSWLLAPCHLMRHV